MHRHHKALPPECALAAEHFNQFCSGNTMKQILALFRSICGILSLKPTRLPDFYPKLKEKLANNWKAQAIFKKLDARACHKVYEKGTACANLRILIIGAGPCGLRAAIENQLLGAKVVVIEKRDRMARNNVLHLWPFVIHDLRALGAKKFYGKFCAGSIDHISIRQLQQILLKVCLVLGVEIHEGVGYEELIEPTISESGEKLGWRARVEPADHPVSQYEFDAIIGADGKRNTLRGFRRKEFRGKLAIAITANFINRHTEQEASVEEISGVAFIFKQKFFIDLKAETGIDLENIVYYKDETHYFVMTAKKKSLLVKGVLKEDHNDTVELLSPQNVNHEALKNYAMEAAVYSTKGQMPNLTFALNARGEEDVSLFDFTSMTSALNASTVLERGGHRLLMCLVGDSLLEPFWPTGSGAARGFLSALDAAWAVRAWGAAPQPHPVDVIAERESIYRLLGQTTPENINRDFGSYTLDPHTRYPNLNSSIVPPHKALQFYDSDDPLPIDASASMRKRRREAQVSQETLMAWVGRALGRAVTSLEEAVSPVTVAALVRSYRPDLLPVAASDLASYGVLMDEFDIKPMLAVRSSVREEMSEGRMRAYLRSVYRAFKGEVPHMHHSPEALAAMAVVEPSHDASEERPSEHARRARKRRSRTHVETGRAAGEPGARVARGGTVARLAAELARGGRADGPARARKPGDLLRAVGRIDSADWNVREIERQIHENRLGRPRASGAQRVPKWDRQQFLLRQKRLETAAGEGEDERYGELDETIRRLDEKRRDSGRPQHGTKKVASLAKNFAKKAEPEPEKQVVKQWSGPRSVTVAPPIQHCTVCAGRVFAAEAVTADGLMLHKACFRCSVCRAALRPGCYTVSPDGARLTCLRHNSVTVRDGVPKAAERLPAVRERFGLDEDAEREMDEDEWTDRNFLASETSGAGGLSDEDSSSDEYTEAAESLEGAEGAARGGSGAGAAGGAADLLYLSDDDSYGYDQSSEDCASSSGSEWASRREARRREVPARRGAAADSSEEDSEESESSELATSSATEVSTDSEFEEEEAAPPKVPPAITVTAPPPPPPPRPRPPAVPPAPSPLSRTRSAGGLATKRALELKRLYLLGEPSPAPVRRSDSASHIDAKNVNMNITEIQKLLHPAPAPILTEQNRPTKLFLMEYATEKPQQPVLSIQRNECEPPPDILADIPKSPPQEMQLDTDSLSDDSSSVTRTGPNVPPPRLEVHNASGELVQLDSLLIVGDPSEPEEEEKDRHVVETKATEVASKPESESSESCRDATTLALTENELSDWAADGVLDELEEKPDSTQGRRTSTRNLRVLSAPKNIHETKNISALTAHVCGRTADEEPVIYSNAIEHFEFADEGEDVSITVLPPRNAGYMEFVDDDYREDDNLVKDRSINFIERPSSMFVEYPSLEPVVELKPVESEDLTEESPKNSDETTSPIIIDSETPTITELSSTLLNNGNYSLSKSSFTNLTEMSSSKTSTSNSEETSPPLTVDVPTLAPGPISFSVPLTFMVRSPAPYERIPEEATPTTVDPSSPSTSEDGGSPPAPDRSYCIAKSASASPVSPQVEASSKVEEIKRARENQTEVVRRLVLERMGGSPGGRKSSRRPRASPGAAAPPPVPPPPHIPPPPERPPPPLRLVPSMSDPELTRVRRRRGIIQTVSDFFNRRVGSRKKWRSEPERFNVSKEDCCCGETAREGAAGSRLAGERRRASHTALHDVTAVSLAAVAPTHFHLRACCPSYHRPAVGPPMHVKIWSME